MDPCLLDLRKYHICIIFPPNFCLFGPEIIVIAATRDVSEKFFFKVYTSIRLMSCDELNDGKQSLFFIYFF